MNDILMDGSAEQQHDARLRAAFDRLSRKNVTVNSDKCKFGHQANLFLGDITRKDTIRSFEDLVHAV